MNSILLSALNTLAKSTTWARQLKSRSSFTGYLRWSLRHRYKTLGIQVETSSMSPSDLHVFKNNCLFNVAIYIFLLEQKFIL